MSGKNTLKEFAKSGITGQTFREIREKFGEPLNGLAQSDPVMSTYAVGFAWFREREHLQVQEAFDKVMGLSVDGVEGLFEDSSKPGVAAVADFVSQPPTTTP